jgi:RNA polymerase sigma factor for flagellar operon FliA
MTTTPARRASRGDITARDAVLRQHLGLVYHVAQGLSRSRANDVELDDLVSAGTLGLIDAFEHFDASRGLAFSTYAAPRIRGAMLDELRRLDRVPRSVRRKTRRIDGAARDLEGLLGRPPGHAEIADGLGIDMPTLWRWQAERESTHLVSLDRASSAAEHGRGAGDWLAGASGTEVDDAITLGQEADHLREALLELPEQERTVLSLYYFEELKLTEIARILDVSESRISQIRSKAIQRLRKMLGRLRAPVPAAPRGA